MPGRRLAKQAAHHRPLLPDQPRKPAGVGEGWGADSGSSSPSPQTAGREGGSWGDYPPPFRPLWAHPPTLTSPPSAGARIPPNSIAPLGTDTPNEAETATRHHRCCSLAGEGASPPGPPPH